MTVYIEYVLFNNFVIDYLLLKATFALTNLPAKRGWLFLCAFLGAGIALVFPLIKAHAVILTLLKIFTGLLLILIANKYKTAKEYYINAVIFIFLTFAVGGAVIGIYELFGLDFSSEPIIALTALPAYAVIKAVTSAVKYIYRKKEIIKNVCDLWLCLGKETLSVRGFIDTGNFLYDGDTPVIVCDKKIAIKLFGVTLPKIAKLSYSTADGKAEMSVIRGVEIYFKDEPNKIYNVTLGVARGSVGTGYDVILHPALMEDNNERICSIKRVS